MRAIWTLRFKPVTLHAMTSFTDKFTNIGAPRKIWTVAAINGQRAHLARIHDKILSGFQPGDRLVYTGNYLCAAQGADPRGVINDLLAFRRNLLARSGLLADDLIYLRGVQEELWTKLAQIQMAQNPRQIITWMQENHPEMDSLLQAYGSSLDGAGRVAREGILSLTRWSGALKAKLREHAGAEKFFTVLRRAAFTEQPAGYDNDNILFVHAGINPGKSLIEQNDQFWWAHKNFSNMTAAYSPFRTVIRGSDPQNAGVKLGDITVSLDGGCGRGGDLVCAQLSPTGDVLDVFAA